MAEPTTEITDVTDEREILREWETLWNAPGRREAVERTLELLRALDDRGLLEAARAVVEGSAPASRALEEFLVKSERLRLARNARLAYELFAGIDLESILRPRAKGEEQRLIGFWELHRRLRDPDVSAGLEIVFAALAQIGRSRRPP